jgi:hypothetical protein
MKNNAHQIRVRRDRKNIIQFGIFNANGVCIGHADTLDELKKDFALLSVYFNGGATQVLNLFTEEDFE